MNKIFRRLRSHNGGRLQSRYASRAFFAGVLIITIARGLSATVASAQVVYRIESLGYLGGCTSSAPSAAGLNEAGQVTGDACNANGDDHAFLWKNDGTAMVDLGPDEVGFWSNGMDVNALGQMAGWGADSIGTFAFVSSGDGASMRKIRDVNDGFIEDSAINDLGEVAGTAYMGGSFQHAFVWKSKGSSLIDLGTLGGNASLAYAINNSGQVAGSSEIPGVNQAEHAFLWKSNGTPMLDLGTLGGDSSTAFFINASGQVAGNSTLPGTVRHPGPEHAFFWRNDGTPMQDVGTLGGAVFPDSLNDSGQIAGFSYTKAINRIHAFVWLNDGSPIHDLRTFGGNRSVANSINSSGEVTGWAALAGDTSAHAFLWRNDGTRIRDLNKLVDPTDPLQPYITLNNGEFINDRGDVVAAGTDSRTGLQSLYLLESMGPAHSALALAPRTLAFGGLPIDNVSAPQSVAVTNTSANAVAITGIALRGTAPGQFAFIDDCAKSLASHAKCTIQVVFKPTAQGPKSAFLNVNGGGGGLRSVSLSGTGM